jgi:hypothetical protein
VLIVLISSCCCRIFAIVIDNSNAARDDNFKILLNGVEIGTIDNSHSDFTGRIFTDSGHVDKFTADSIQTPNPNLFEPTLAFDFSLLSVSNTLRIESIVDNSNSNFGRIRVGYWTATGTFDRYIVSEEKMSGVYVFSSGVGNGQDYSFTYP